MRSYLRHEVDFIGLRKIFFIISAVLIVISLASLATRGLKLGIEFQGGTSIDFQDTGSITTEQVRSAFDAAGVTASSVQTTQTNGIDGFLVRTAETTPDVASGTATTVATSLGLSSDSFQVTTIGPEWSTSILNSSLLAFVISILAIIAYIAIRFEYKMSITAVIALFHDLIIVMGIYSLTGREVTPNVVAALLTILGYSLYDTVVVFHRINDNANPEGSHSFSWIANHSINQVFTRTINTTFTSLLPVLFMLFFGGSTLKDFAFAMTWGLLLGSYSSIGIASPLFTLWKSREPQYRKLAKKYADK